jgi:hypothetical protein
VSVVVQVLANDEGDELQLDSVGTPAHGVATPNIDGSVTYAPAAGFEGSDAFSYTISDGNGGMDTADVSITVMPRRAMHSAIASLRLRKGAGSRSTPIASRKCGRRCRNAPRSTAWH